MLDRERFKLCSLLYFKLSVRLFSPETRTVQDSSLMSSRRFSFWFDYGSSSLQFALMLHDRKCPSSENTYQNFHISSSSAVETVTSTMKCGYLH